MMRTSWRHPDTTKRSTASTALVALVAALGLILVPTSAALAQAELDEPVEVIVTFESEATAERMDLSAQGSTHPAVEDARTLHRFQTFPGAVMEVQQDQLGNLLAMPGVAAVERVQPINFHRVPNDPEMALRQWALENNGTRTGSIVDADIDATDAWNITTGDSSVVVAVLDTGVDTTHPDLRNNIWRNPGEIAGNGIDDDGNGYVDDINGWDFVNKNNSVFDPDDDVEDHGTHVAGIVAAEGDNGIGVAGVTWNSKVMVLKVLSDEGGNTAMALAAVDYATAMGVRIMNGSFGGANESAAFHRAIDRCECLYVASAGNDGQNNDSTPSFPAAHEGPNVMAVANTDSADGLAANSNYGATTVDIAAPGSFIYSTVAGGGYAFWSGTSMAAPHVAGSAALLLSADPSLSPAAIKARLIAAVDRSGDLASATASGGRLNVYRAIASPSIVNGDVNCNGQREIDDARRVSLFAVGLIQGVDGCPATPTELNETVADVDGQPGVTINDARLLTQCAIGIPNIACPG